MISYKSRVAFLLRRFKGFWNEFKRTRRGLVGIVVVILFIGVAVVGPSLTTHDPLRPVWPGYYPAGPAPATNEMAVPIWYRRLPGGSELYSENMEAVSDYTFSSNPFSSPTSQWSAKINNTNLASISYNSNKGSQSDGAIQISYAHQANTSETTTSVIMNYSFRYPYKPSPTRFWIHTSYNVEGTVSLGGRIKMNILFYRKDPAPLLNYTYNKYTDLVFSEGSSTVYKFPMITYDITAITPMWKDVWTQSTHSLIWNDKKWYYNTEAVVFPTAGDYVFTIEVVFNDPASSQTNATVYLDNLNVLLYGNAFGLLGADGVIGQPRDIFTSMMWGARISVVVGLLSASVSVTIGLLLGLTAGYLGGVTDEAIMRIADFIIGLPGLPLLIVLAVVLRPSVWNIVMILAFMGWMGFSRSIRSMTLSLRETAFVEAARASGSGNRRVLFRHILPNVFPLVYLVLATSVPGAIVAEASVSFLGLFDPTLITWGRMLNEFATSGIAITKGFDQYWFWIMPPGVAISSIAIAFILVGYSLDEILNPKLRQRR